MDAAVAIRIVEEMLEENRGRGNTISVVLGEIQVEALRALVALARETKTKE